VLNKILDWATSNGYSVKGLIRSPIVGAKGNLEFLVWLRPGNITLLDHSVLIDSVIEPQQD
jgi:hypothetical protein